jgi:hypothetical protein
LGNGGVWIALKAREVHLVSLNMFNAVSERVAAGEPSSDTVTTTLSNHVSGSDTILSLIRKKHKEAAPRSGNFGVNGNHLA